MQRIIFYVVASLCLLVSKMSAQETFEGRAKLIAQNIEKITKEEKLALKLEVEEVNKQLESGKITQEQADKMKIDAANLHAKNIEERVASEQQQLNALVQEKVDSGVSDTTKTKNKKFIIRFLESEKEPGMERKTTTQFVVAVGYNNLITNGAVANSDFSYTKSAFYEFGLTRRTRLGKFGSKANLKYGFSFMYNMLTMTDNRYFVDKGNETVLEAYPIELRQKESYFKNVYFAVPVHLEFDFSKKTIKDDKAYYKSHNGFRFGVGGFVGCNTNSKQFLSYNVDGYKIKERQKGDWNVNDWNYGLSAYVGWKGTSLYAKYDLNPVFENNPIKQRNASLGIRFDLN